MEKDGERSIIAYLFIEIVTLQVLKSNVAGKFLLHLYITFQIVHGPYYYRPHQQNSEQHLFQHR